MADRDHLTQNPRLAKVGAITRAGIKAYGFAGGLALRGILSGIRRTASIRYEGLEERRRLGSAIDCLWHRDFILYFFTHPYDVAYSTLLHPALYLRPWEVFARRYGWTPFFGSSGHGGRKAADRLTTALADGESTFVCPDGPAGPAGQPKSGVFHMAAQAKRPIVPVTFAASGVLPMKSWDRRLLPMPGMSVTMRFGEPIYVESDRLSDARTRLIAGLGRPD